jgi:hypothetical protein
MTALLEDLVSRDPNRVWSGSCAVIKLRDPELLDLLAGELPRIRAATENLPLGGMVFSNSEHLRFAVRKLEYCQQRAGCLCRLYPEYLFFNPEVEAAAGNISIEGITYVENRWVDAYSCVCTLCGIRYRVEERESHYMWWRWAPVQ